MYLCTFATSIYNFTFQHVFNTHLHLVTMMMQGLHLHVVFLFPFYGSVDLTVAVYIA